VVVFAVVVVHNVFERNWVSWFGTPLPILLSKPVSLAVWSLFLFVPMTLVYYVLTENGRAVGASTRIAAI